MGPTSQEQMVEEQLVRRGIRDEAILAAFRSVPRASFVHPAQLADAHRDGPLAIAEGQTISQPYVVALTAQALQLTGSERVLEVGTGSGYAAAILGRLARQVLTVERHASLASGAKQTLEGLGVTNVEVHLGDGTLGFPAQAPFDAIAVAAGGPRVPLALTQQLAVGGRLVIPVGPAEQQTLMRITRVTADSYREEPLLAVRFVALVGAQGWPR